MKKLFTVCLLSVSLPLGFSQNKAVSVKSPDEAKSKMSQAAKVPSPVTTTPTTSAVKGAPTAGNKAIPALPTSPHPMAAENPNAAAFKFNEETHDFGTVSEGPEVKFDFEYINIGKEPLILQNVHASCGCTTPVWSKEPILPNQKSKISVVYHTQGRPGTFSKTITISSNAKGGEKLLYIKGLVEKAPTSIAPEKAPNLINEISNH